MPLNILLCLGQPPMVENLGSPKCQYGFSGGSDGEESVCDAGAAGLIPGLGRAPGEGNGYLLQYSCLDNSRDRGALQATVHGVVKSWT